MIILTQESHNVSASNDWNGRSSYQINSKHNETIYTGVKLYTKNSIYRMYLACVVVKAT